MRILIIIWAACLCLSFDVINPIQTQNNIQFVVTGEGETKLDPRWQEFPLKLVMVDGVITTKKKEVFYTPKKNIEIKIYTKHQEKLIDVKNAGPWFLVKLSPGDYYVYTKDQQGIERNQTVRVHKPKKKKKQDIYYFEWE
jgi:hypothetical protein